METLFIGGISDGQRIAVERTQMFFKTWETREQRVFSFDQMTRRAYDIRDVPVKVETYRRETLVYEGQRYEFFLAEGFEMGDVLPMLLAGYRVKPDAT